MVLVTVAVAAFVADWGPPDALVAGAHAAGHGPGRRQRQRAQSMARARDRRSHAAHGRSSAAGRPLERHAGRCIRRRDDRRRDRCIWRWRSTRSTAALGLLTWVLYVWIYTPLKTRTSANTAVGAVAGALPVLMGWTAVGAPLDLRAWSLFLIVFLWQFPHFMAIAWIYRAAIRRGRAADAAGRRSQRHRAGGAGGRVGAGADSGQPGAGTVAVRRPRFIFCGRLLLGAGQLACAVSFFVERSDASARRLLLASLVYLPAMMGLLLLGPLA